HDGGLHEGIKESSFRGNRLFTKKHIASGQKQCSSVRPTQEKTTFTGLGIVLAGESEQPSTILAMPQKLRLMATALPESLYSFLAACPALVKPWAGLPGSILETRRTQHRKSGVFGHTLRTGLPSVRRGGVSDQALFFAVFSPLTTTIWMDFADDLVALVGSQRWTTQYKMDPATMPNSTISSRSMTSAADWSSMIFEWGNGCCTFVQWTASLKIFNGLHPTQGSYHTDLKLKMA
ncbi:hypothetical protein BDZ89DRAFT_1245229, partial [Hymenopellis radicata]